MADKVLGIWYSVVGSFTLYTHLYRQNIQISIFPLHSGIKLIHTKCKFKFDLSAIHISQWQRSFGLLTALIPIILSSSRWNVYICERFNQIYAHEIIQFRILRIFKLLHLCIDQRDSFIRTSEWRWHSRHVHHNRISVFFDFFVALLCQLRNI